MWWQWCPCAVFLKGWYIMAKNVKKVDAKTVEKQRVMKIIAQALINAGIDVLDGADYGMTVGTVVVRTAVTDVQIKPIVPKAGLNRYQEVPEEE